MNLIRKLLAIALPFLAASHAERLPCYPNKIPNCGSYVNACAPKFKAWSMKNCYTFCGHCKSCGEGWRYYPGDQTCIKVFGSIYSAYNAQWDAAAQGGCAGGHLVIIRDPGKNKFVQSLIPKRLKFAWIGLKNYVFSGYVFNWVKGGGSLGYFHPWRTGQPDNYKGMERCVRMNYLGQWNDANCGYKAPYVCERPPRANTIHI